MGLTTATLVPAIVAISFAAGLNVYATVATLGLLCRFGVFPLPPEPHLLSNNWVIARRCKPPAPHSARWSP